MIQGNISSFWRIQICKHVVMECCYIYVSCQQQQIIVDCNLRYQSSYLFTVTYCGESPPMYVFLLSVRTDFRFSVGISHLSRMKSGLSELIHKITNSPGLMSIFSSSLYIGLWNIDVACHVAKQNRISCC